jgi:NAD(P)-dependent dehydrogenase (short-subunit alcohol dehydrogenase family)
MSARLEGKVAAITGGCSGIGLATVEEFVNHGARVVVADVQDEKGLALEQRFPEQVAYSHCDVTLEGDIIKALALAESQFGGLDILVLWIWMPMPGIKPLHCCYAVQC